uniref:Uncharacterized protein n=1 Tax=Lepeophtheirus salmonis TaxID=72036 RepID=A0A0K2VF91_LEPSM
MYIYNNYILIQGLNIMIRHNYIYSLLNISWSYASGQNLLFFMRYLLALLGNKQINLHLRRYICLLLLFPSFIVPICRVK